MNRRDFLKLSALSSSALALSPVTLIGEIAKAETTSKRFLLFIHVTDGWDVTLGLDPWLKPDRPSESDMFIEYTHNEVLNSGNLFFGPSGAPLLKHAQDISVVNGILVAENDNGHPAAMLYMDSGNGQGKAAQIAFELESIENASPYGAVVDFSPIYLSTKKVSYVAAIDLINSINTEDPSAMLKKSVHDPRSALERAISEVVKGEGVTTNLKAKLTQLQQQTPTLTSSHAMAAAFAAGASTYGLLTLRPKNGSLDTHSNHQKEHMRMLTEVFQQISDIFDLFKSIQFGGSSLFDNTLFVVTSEFARTAALNSAGGKDHNPLTNSVLFAGAGIQKGKMINSSIMIPAAQSATGLSYHMASPFDYSTGLSATTKAGANFIYPENFIATVATASGIDMNKFKAVPQGTKVIPGLLA